MSFTAIVATTVFGLWAVASLFIAFAPPKTTNRILAYTNRIGLFFRWSLFVSPSNDHEIGHWKIRTRQLQKGSVTDWTEVPLPSEGWRTFHLFWHPEGMHYHSLHRCCERIASQRDHPRIERCKEFKYLLTFVRESLPENSGSTATQIRLERIDSSGQHSVFESRFHVKDGLMPG